MTYKSISNLTDGVFADWEILNSLINNVSAVRSEIPQFYVHYKSGRTNKLSTNIEFSAQRGRTLHLHKGTISLEAGVHHFSKLKDKDSIFINTSINGNSPIINLTVASTRYVRAYVTKAGTGGFNINIVNSSSAKQTGSVFWTCIRSR